MEYVLYVLIALYGLCFGSFTNVLIYRIPRGMEWIRTPSHCLTCNHRLRWYENIPLLSYLLQRGRCRSCGVRISPQYPIIEALVGAFWLLTALLYRSDPITLVLYCLLLPPLLALSVIDWRTLEIPDGFPLFIALLGALRLATDFRHWSVYLLGAVSVSGFFLLLYLATRGRGIGFGDVKLMAAAGLLIGFPNILLAMFLGFVSGSIVHLFRMRWGGAGRMLAFGPYLAFGIWCAALFGPRIIRWYLSLF